MMILIQTDRYPQQLVLHVVPQVFQVIVLQFLAFVTMMAPQLVLRVQVVPRAITIAHKTARRQVTAEH